MYCAILEHHLLFSSKLVLRWERGSTLIVLYSDGFSSRCSCSSSNLGLAKNKQDQLLRRLSLLQPSCLQLQRVFATNFIDHFVHTPTPSGNNTHGSMEFCLHANKITINYGGCDSSRTFTRLSGTCRYIHTCSRVLFRQTHYRRLHNSLESGRYQLKLLDGETKLFVIFVMNE